MPVAQQTFTNAGAQLPANLQFMYDRAALKAAIESFNYDKYATEKYLAQNNGKTYKVSRYRHIIGSSQVDGADVNYVTSGSRTIADVTAGLPVIAEGAGAVNGVNITKDTFEITVARYGAFIPFSDEIDMFHEDPVLMNMSEEIGYMGGEVVDDVHQLAILGGTNVRYASAAANRAAVDANITTADLDSTILSLKKAKAKKQKKMLTGTVKIGTTPIRDAYIAIIHPDVVEDLRLLDGFKSVETYAANGDLLDNEVGTYREIRFVENTRVMDLGTGTNTKTIYPTVVFGMDAFFSLSVRGKNKFWTRVVAPEHQSSTNPHGTQGTMAFGAFTAAKILQNEYLVRIETNSSVA